jgi:hypothetical protein
MGTGLNQRELMTNKNANQVVVADRKKIHEMEITPAIQRSLSMLEINSNKFKGKGQSLFP